MKKTSRDIEVLELYSTQGVHSNFLTALVTNLYDKISLVFADRNAISLARIDKSKIRLLSAPSHHVLRDLYLGVIGVWRLWRADKPILVTGAGPLVHLLLALFGRLRHAAIVVHSEFSRAYRAKYIGDRLIKFSFRLYRIRRTILVVLSDSTRKEVVRRGIYPEEYLLLLTHPLLACAESIVRSPVVRCAALIGLIREQKYNRAADLIPKLKRDYNVTIVAFGKAKGVTYADLSELFEHVQLHNQRYSEEELRSFLVHHQIGALVFLGGDEYALTTSGVVCDATRLGCFVLGPEDFCQGYELIGDLYSPKYRCLVTPTSSSIQAIVDERARKNRAELDALTRRICDER